ncbi:hypothetical protein [Methanopyrus kandleri]|uniref:Uncharacterized protein n=2 Tax=Methanopyrus kandleri TaxID=2320 RepID=Q8TXX4_METKA|nr:hypothetical protein [Methanopyrus kandleri]AAM01750.1 Uncharacterized protein MK0535 [Methanopyrus kandleri AV19]HII70304.1 hypothetical protein [Methanopyrus kandleri]
MHARCRCHTVKPTGANLRPLMKYIVAFRPGVDKRSLFRAVYLLDKAFERETGRPLTGTEYGHCMLLKAPYFSVDVKEAIFDLLRRGEIELRPERRNGELVSTYYPVGYRAEDIEDDVRREYSLHGDKWRLFREVLERVLGGA